MIQHKAARFLLVLSALICAGGGKCEDEDKARVRSACDGFDVKKAHCADIVVDGCDGPCDPECVARGELALEESSDCAELYIAYYGCVTSLSCEDISAWADALRMESTDHGCIDEDLKFRAECANLALHPLD